MANTRTGTAYVQLRRERGMLHDLRVVKTTQKRPESPEPGCIVVKVRFDVPDNAWAYPEVAVSVSTELPVIQVEPVPAEDVTA